MRWPATGAEVVPVPRRRRRRRPVRIGGS